MTNHKCFIINGDSDTNIFKGNKEILVGVLRRYGLKGGRLIFIIFEISDV